MTGGAKLGLSNAIVAIVDDERSVGFVTSVTNGVEGKTITIPIVRGGSLNSTGRVDYMFMDGTATNGVDFTATNGTLIFKPGQFLKTITVKLSTDGTNDGGETFTVVLKNATNVFLTANSNLTVTITNAPNPNGVAAAGVSFLKVNVDGTAFNPKMDLIGSYLDGKFNLSASQMTGLQVSTLTHSFSFNQISIDGPGTYQVPEPATGDLAYSFSGPIGFQFFNTSRGEGSGTLTIDVLNEDVVAGRFDFTLGNIFSADTRNVAGSFRIRV